MDEPLDRLCALYGVLPRYTDIWGGEHHTPEETKRALLGAMGVSADSDEEIDVSLLAFERRKWERVLPAVQVVRDSEHPCRIAVALPRSEENTDYRWRLRRESGYEEAGGFTPAGLECTEACHLDGRDFARYVLALDVVPEPGYHRLFIEREQGGSAVGEMSLIVAPASCYMPPSLQADGRVWGFAAQLYAIRSGRNWGVGDFGDLRRMLELCAETGASTVLLNPLHALFPDAPEHASPYSPSNRAYFNTLYLDVEGIPEFAECEEARAAVRTPEFRAQLRALRATEQVDYESVAQTKTRILERLYEYFRSHHLAQRSERAQAFRDFQAAHGDSLRKQALFEALQSHFRAQDDSVWGWPAWPEAWRDPHAPEVAAFCEANLARVEFFEYLQWQAFDQLRAAGTRSWELGLGVGVMLDLAIGVAEGGAASWTRRELYALRANTGAPPDEINRHGQDWGLPPWIPHRLTEAAYEPFIELLRANMRDAGALRIDHVMGLYRLFWVARGLPVAQGAYVACPFADLLGILALESRRNRCLVVGEDLGTVPDEVRLALHPMGVLSTRLLYFEREPDGRLMPPQAYPEQALTAVTTHDLPTLAGFWQGQDLDLRERLGLFPDNEVRNSQVVMRSEDRAQLLVALEGEGVLPPGGGLQPIGFPEMTAELAAAVYTYLARAPSKLLLVQMEDCFGVREQPNLPGVVEPVYPCWRLKLPLNVEGWTESAWLHGILLALRGERPVKRVAGQAGGALGEGLRSWIPRATYRLQLNRDFRLSQAAELIPYLDELGISHCYLSPLLKARPGSPHGYDITDHSSLNPEIAGAEDFERFAAALRQRGMGLIMDMVPNHMGVMGADNGWWLDVLENGPSSRYAGYFDIDWYPIAENLPGRVLLPVLGDHYGAVLENGELRLVFDPGQGSFSMFYFRHRFPVDPREYPRILGLGIERLQARLGADDASLLEFQTLLTAFGHLPTRDGIAPEAVSERNRDKEVHKRHLASLYESSADVARYLDENLAAFNGAAGNFDPLHELLQAQAYRLAYWRVAADEINYRRFFDINDLAALRMDNIEVFESAHRLIRELLARGLVNGLRIDHPDGLYAPQEYFERMQALARSLQPSPPPADEDEPGPLYMVVEKILAEHEHLPKTWAIHGSTGYDFAAACGSLFVDRSAVKHVSRTYHSFIRAKQDYGETVRGNKHRIMESSLAGELQVLATQLMRIARDDRYTCDFTLNSLRGALAEVVASFPVYRTYVTSCEAAREDAKYVELAVENAKKRSHAADTSIFDFIRDVLLARHGQGRDDAYRQAVCAFSMKFQQYTGPVMAKAVEDTTFYQYNRLAALNEVGGDPHRFGISPAAFHRKNRERAEDFPHAMLAGSTHDSKRSEDVRARLVALSEMHEDWRQALVRWSRIAHSRVGTGLAPDRNDEYLFYQTLLGVWPFETPDGEELARLERRVADYMVKAAREAKVRSSWINPNAEYEEAVRNFVGLLLAAGEDNPFLLDFVPFHARFARAGALTSLSQLLLRLSCPGVPDVYQGSEMWDFSLVDPDNRRPVDYAKRRQALLEIRTLDAERGAAGCARELLDSLPDGRIKLYLMWKTLSFRREHEALFRDGDYLPLETKGAHADRVCAFARRHNGETLLTAAPRLFSRLMGKEVRLPVGGETWGETRIALPPGQARGRWTCALTGRTFEPHGGELALAQLFGEFPWALLHQRGERE